MTEDTRKERCGNLYPSAPRVAVGAVVTSLNRDGQQQVLMVKRRNPPAERSWSVPGGSIELGETMFQAVIREVQEETGVKVAPMPIFSAVDAIYHDDRGRIQYHYVIIYVLAKYLGGQLRAGDDALEACWFTMEELPGLKPPGRTIECIKAVLAQGEVEGKRKDKKRS